MSQHIPSTCFECKYLDALTIDGTNFPVCRNRQSYDKDNRPLFVMPEEEPPEFCGLRRKQFFDMLSQARAVAKKYGINHTMKK